MRGTLVQLDLDLDTRTLHLLRVRDPLIPQDVELHDHDARLRQLPERVVRREDRRASPGGTVSVLREVGVPEPEHARGRQLHGVLVLRPGRVWHASRVGGVVDNGNNQELETEGDGRFCLDGFVS